MVGRTGCTAASRPAGPSSCASSARGPEDIVATTRLEVTDPAETIGAAIDFFRRAIDAGTRLDAIGLGSFGPVELRRGHPAVRIDHDDAQGGLVGHAAGRAVRDGIRRARRLRHRRQRRGARRRPVGCRARAEIVRLPDPRDRDRRRCGRRRPGSCVGSFTRRWATWPCRDTHPTRSTASAPSTATASRGWPADRRSRPASGVAGRIFRATEQTAAAELVGFYVGAGIRSMVYVLAPERIVIGGGLSALPGVIEAARAELDRQLGGYPACRSIGIPSSSLPRCSAGRPDRWGH